MSEGYHRPVLIPVDHVMLEGVLAVPPDAQMVVVFVHGSGSSRHSPRNRHVAQVINDAGIGTLLFDLLTRDEDSLYENRFDIGLLTARLEAVTKWLKGQPKTKNLAIGYFGASTGAAAALRAAAGGSEVVSAVVSRGGRPDLAGDALRYVKTPTLLIVGGHDDVVIELNEEAYRIMKGEKALKIVPGATHLFEEPGTLEDAARLAVDWFVRHTPKAG
jgi:putative phosphoribosyl transferase